MADMKYAVWALAGAAALFASAPIVKLTFESDDAGWLTMGGPATVAVTHDAANVKSGKGALEFTYEFGKTPSLVVWPASVALDSMQSIRFWLKTSEPTPVAVWISEKEPGGRYVSIVWSPANTWQRIELGLADFSPSDGPNDPKDPDGKLDVDSIQGIGLLDLGQLFAAGAISPDVPIRVDAKAGRHSLYIDDFELASDAPAAPSQTGFTIDKFDRPYLRWFTLGGAELSIEKIGAAAGMRARYEQVEDRLVILTRMLPKLDLRGSERLAFDIASEKDATLALSLEERLPGKQQGPRYTTTIEVIGGGKPEHRAVALSAFQHDPNSTDDANGMLDLDQVKSISILDITANATHETAKNSLWISSMETVK